MSRLTSVFTRSDRVSRARASRLLAREIDRATTPGLRDELIIIAQRGGLI